MAVIKRIRLDLTADQVRDNSAKFISLVRSHLTGQMRNMLQLISKSMKDKAPVNNQTLKGSIIGIPKVKRGKISGLISMLSYGQFQNDGFGGTGKLPNLDALEQWVRNKKIVKGRGKNKKKLERGVAIAIARKIRDKGVRGSGFIDKSLEETKDQVLKLAEKAIKGIENLI